MSDFLRHNSKVSMLERANCGSYEGARTRNHTLQMRVI